MPVCVKKQKSKYRITDCDTGKITKNRAGTAVDGGGHPSKITASSQARAINASLKKQGKI